MRAFEIYVEHLETSSVLSVLHINAGKCLCHYRETLSHSEQLQERVCEGERRWCLNNSGELELQIILSSGYW